LVLLGTSLALVTHGWVYDVVLAAQLLLLAAAAAGVGIARYYVLVSWATVVALWNYLRRGVPATWEAAEATRCTAPRTSPSPEPGSCPRARCSRSPPSRSSSTTAGRSSTGRPASVATVATSSC